MIVLTHSIPATAHHTDNKYFNKKNPVLTKQERQALKMVERWQKGKSHGGIQPFAGRNGAIQYVFGVQSPSIICAVLQICDIALQPGENVNSIQLGDTARWHVEPAVSGSGIYKTQHLLIKPMDVGLETSLVVATDRRVYHIRLRSHRTKYMPQTSFTYPEEVLAKWDTIQHQEQKKREQKILPKTREYLGDLSFNYEISGSAPWKPIRVFNDGRKTIIQMPKKIQQTEAPTLLVVRKEGGLLSNDETIMVNYRIQKDRYIVDTVFEKAILIAGVGKQQTKISITKKE